MNKIITYDVRIKVGAGRQTLRLRATNAANARKLALDNYTDAVSDWHRAREIAKRNTATMAELRAKLVRFGPKPVLVSW